VTGLLKKELEKQISISKSYPKPRLLTGFISSDFSLEWYVSALRILKILVSPGNDSSSQARMKCCILAEEAHFLLQNISFFLLGKVFA